MIALLIAYEAASRIFDPVPIHFPEAILIACLGLAVNIASALILGTGERHSHEHGHSHHEHTHGAADRDNNMRAAVAHVMADAAVSVLVIIGLLLAFAFGWLWMDPLAGIIGACVIASWSYRLTRDTGAILLDMNPDRHLAEHMREMIEEDGDRVSDLHLWRVGPGHLAAVLTVSTSQSRDPDYYRSRLARFRSLSHVTIEVRAT